MKIKKNYVNIDTDGELWKRGEKMNKSIVLIVDEKEENEIILKNALKEKYIIISVKNNKQLKNQVEINQNQIALIITSLSLFQSGGFNIINKSKEKKMIGEAGILVIIEKASNKSEEIAYSLGASDTIKKPFNTDYIINKKVERLVSIYNYQNNLEHLLKMQNEKILSQTSKLMEQTEKLNKININMMESISSVVEWRDWETGKHIKRLRCFTESLLVNVAKEYPEYELEKEDIDMIAMASTTHDIGKIAIPDAILLKPGKLTSQEFEIMKTHTTKGSEIICNFNAIDVNNYLGYCQDICRYHHEKWDGKGYPEGLVGDEIPIWAQVVSIADCFDALTSDRPYKKAFSSKTASEMILDGQCGVFSPKIINSFKNVLPEFENLAVVYKG